jgi:hypothetical protein
MRRVCTFVPATTRIGASAPETATSANPRATVGAPVGAPATRDFLRVRGGDASGAAVPAAAPDRHTRRRLAGACCRRVGTGARLASIVGGATRLRFWLVGAVNRPASTDSQPAGKVSTAAASLKVEPIYYVES